MRTEYRVHIFADFWNYTLSLAELDREFSTDWARFPKILTREAGALIDPTAQAIYSGMNVYGSYNASTEVSLKNWANSILDTFPGVNAQFKPRTKKKSHPKCAHCHSEIKLCPSCQQDMRGTEEKGIDTLIATDLVALAWAGAFDVAVLVSSDQDFVPAAEHLQTRGLKVIQAGFAPHGMLLRQKCWGSIDLSRFYSEWRYLKRRS